MNSCKTACLIISCVSLLALTANSYADKVTNERDLKMLPRYCWGTQGQREISKLPQSTIDNYYRTYGPIYHDLHHYCWALMGEINAYKIFDKGKRDNSLHQALNDIQYVLDKNPPPSFPPLGDIYATKARILFKLDRPGEAVGNLVRASNLQPGYQPAYAQLSDYYLKTGQKDKAISILEQGVAHNRNPILLLKKLERLGKPFRGTPGSALPAPKTTGKTDNGPVPAVTNQSSSNAPETDSSSH